MQKKKEIPTFIKIKRKQWLKIGMWRALVWPSRSDFMDLEKTEQKLIYSKFAGYVALPNVCLLSCDMLEIFKIFLKFCLYWFSSIYVFDIQYLISFFFFFNFFIKLPFTTSHHTQTSIKCGFLHLIVYYYLTALVWQFILLVLVVIPF